MITVIKPTYSQDQVTSICCYNGDKAKYSNSEICKSLSFINNNEAEEVIDNILSYVGLGRNFVVMECPNIENAIAVNIPSQLGQMRYIIYDNDFMKRVNNATSSDWSAISILAHEVGHHLNGHTLSNSGNHHHNELQADEFSGFVLAKMGASLYEAQAAMRKLASIEDSDSHPGKLKRLKAIKLGYENALKIDQGKTRRSRTDQTVTVDHIDEEAENELSGISFNLNSAGEQIMKYIKRGLKGEGRFTFNILSFHLGSAQIKKSTLVESVNVAAILKAYPSIDIIVEGFTDNTGNANANIQLSQARANAVRTALINNGIDKNRISAEGLGPANPRADNSTQEGRSLNRRIEIVFFISQDEKNKKKSSYDKLDFLSDKSNGKKYKLTDLIFDDNNRLSKFNKTEMMYIINSLIDDNSLSILLEGHGNDSEKVNKRLSNVKDLLMTLGVSWNQISTQYKYSETEQYFAKGE